MKTTYIKPSSRVYKVRIASILTGSGEGSLGISGNSDGSGGGSRQARQNTGGLFDNSSDEDNGLW